MNSRQVQSALNGDKVLRNIFNGVYASNKLPAKPQKPFAIVINLDEHHEPGSHWVAVYASENNDMQYFDSYGRPPTLYSIINFLKRAGGRWTYNEVCLQNPLTTVCGQYCLVYLWMKSRNHNLRDFVELFGANTTSNDLKIETLYNNAFGLLPINRSKPGCQRCTALKHDKRRRP